MLESPQGREVKGCSGQQFKKMATGHFNRFTLLGKCWTSICPQNVFNCLETFFLRTSVFFHLYWRDGIMQFCCRFVDCTSMMHISHSSTSQRCSAALDLVTMEAVGVQRNSWSRTSLRCHGIRNWRIGCRVIG